MNEPATSAPSNRVLHLSVTLVLQLATDVVAWTSFHKVQLDDDPCNRQNINVEFL
jgi:hypothetical protein